MLVLRKVALARKPFSVQWIRLAKDGRERGLAAVMAPFSDRLLCKNKNKKGQKRGIDEVRSTLSGQSAQGSG